MVERLSLGRGALMYTHYTPPKKARRSIHENNLNFLYLVFLDLAYVKIKYFAKVSAKIGNNPAKKK